MPSRGPRIAVALAALVLVAGAPGCGGEDLGEPERNRLAEFIREHEELRDEELARLCPALYPRDFLEDPDRYDYERDEEARRDFAPELREQARRAGCDAPPP
jgi:hypothetical protein